MRRAQHVTPLCRATETCGLNKGEFPVRVEDSPNWRRIAQEKPKAAFPRLDTEFRVADADSGSRALCVAGNLDEVLG